MEQIKTHLVTALTPFKTKSDKNGVIAICLWHAFGIFESKNIWVNWWERDSKLLKSGSNFSNAKNSPKCFTEYRNVQQKRTEIPAETKRRPKIQSVLGDIWHREVSYWRKKCSPLQSNGLISTAKKAPKIALRPLERLGFLDSIWFFALKITKLINVQGQTAIPTNLN